MELTHVLVAVVGMLVGVIATMTTLSKFYVSKDSCRVTVHNCDKLRKQQAVHEQVWKDELNKRLDGMDRSSTIQYHMLRAIVSNMDNLSADAKTQILNTNGTNK